MNSESNRKQIPRKIVTIVEYYIGRSVRMVPTFQWYVDCDFVQIGPQRQIPMHLIMH